SQKGTVSWRDEPVIHFADLAFPTPSGQIEVASQRWVDAGLPRAPQALMDSRPLGHRLRLLSPADVWLMNSSYANDSRIAAKLGEQTVWVHPSEAAIRALSAGQSVTLRSSAGELTVNVGLSDRVPNGVALLPKGRWPSLDVRGANVNVLNPGEKSDLGESSAVHSVEVELEAV
ncbi:MAG: molybdopterin dinucleotide binding domain-containing protein, partial [Georgfuchsia sp.]